MPKIRMFLLALCCLSIPLQGMASIHLLLAPCPLENAELMAQQQSAEAGAQMVAGHDCCNDAETFAKSGHLCKTGQDCTIPALYLGNYAGSLSLRAFQATSYPWLANSLRSFDSANVWRPPALA